MIDFARIKSQALTHDPYDWAFVDNLYSPSDAAELAATYPTDHFKTVNGYDGEKGYSYESRCLIGMGSSKASFPEGLSPAWRQLAADLLSPDYREAMSKLTGRDLSQLMIEVNVFHYGSGAWLGPHLDLKDKVITHVLYFNETWDRRDGGCLAILRSSNMSDEVAEILPTVGNSALIVRSNKSWHAVKRVREGCQQSRRSVTVTFYPAGSVSTMWPPNDQTPLHDYPEKPQETGALSQLKGWFSGRQPVKAP
jgi:SM-20-related protein